MCYPARLFARDSRNLDPVEVLTITFSLNITKLVVMAFTKDVSITGLD